MKNERKFKNNWFARHIVAIHKFDQLQAALKDMEATGEGGQDFIKTMLHRYRSLIEFTKKRMR